MKNVKEINIENIKMYISFIGNSEKEFSDEVLIRLMNCVSTILVFMRASQKCFAVLLCVYLQLYAYGLTNTYVLLNKKQKGYIAALSGKSASSIKKDIELLVDAGILISLNGKQNKCQVYPVEQ